MWFELLGTISDVETIAVGRSIRKLRQLNEKYGKGRWRKQKGMALIRLEDKSVRWTELHWYECHGIGSREVRVKRLLPDVR